MLQIGFTFKQAQTRLLTEKAMLPRSLHLLPQMFACVTVALLSPPASAHDKWLDAEPFFTSTQAPVKLYLLTGDALQKSEMLPIRKRSRMVRFQQLAATGRKDLMPLLHEDAEPIATLPANLFKTGTHLVMLDSAPVDILLSAEKFQAYLFEERLIDILMQRVKLQEEDAPGRERYSRFLKTLLQVGNRFDDFVSAPAGQEFEIVPLANPYKLPLGSTLTVQILFRGQPLPQHAVTFANRYHANVVIKVLRTNDQGQVALPLARGGQWLLSLVHMERSQEKGADWRSYWASLTFALSEDGK